LQVVIARTAARAAAASAVLALLGGCALGYLNPNFLLPGERRERLDAAAQRYAHSLRFGYLEQALPFVEPSARRAFVDCFAPGGTNALRFTDVEVGGIEFDAGFGRATVLLQAHVYRLPSVREERVSETQSWRYDPGARTWYVTPDFTLYSGRADGARAPAAPGTPDAAAGGPASAPRSR
jgi:hypothetical protein